MSPNQDRMTCGSCAARVERTLARQPGVTNAAVNFATGRARIHTEGSVSAGELIEAIDRAGYELLGRRTSPNVLEFDVDGMTCGSGVARVQRGLEPRGGVATSDGNYSTDRARETHDRPVDPTDLTAAVERIRYQVRPAGGVEGTDGNPELEADRVGVACDRTLARHGIVEMPRTLIVEVA